MVFQAYGNNHRKYCSRSCYYLAKRHPNFHAAVQKAPNPIMSMRETPARKKELATAVREESEPRKDSATEVEELLRGIHDPSISAWEKALYLRENGIDCKRISTALGISYNTVTSWRRRYRVFKPQGIENSCRVSTNSRIKTMTDWFGLLSQAMQGFQCTDVETVTYGKSVVLICGTVVMNKGADMLSAIIEYKLKMDPFNGDIYAFIGRSRDRLCFIRWDGSGFHVASRRKERGAYFWPTPRFGQTITVSAREFEYILHGCEER